MIRIRIRKWWRMLVQRRTGTSATPSQAADLEAARAARARISAAGAHASRQQDVAAARWSRVNAVQRALSDIRRQNHLGEDLTAIFRERP